MSYPLLYAMREEPLNEVEMGIVRYHRRLARCPHRHGKKKDGSNRVCVDFRKLNKITEVDSKPMTTAEDLFCQISGKICLSKIDLL